MQEVSSNTGLSGDRKDQTPFNGMGLLWFGEETQPSLRELHDGRTMNDVVQHWEHSYRGYGTEIMEALAPLYFKKPEYLTVPISHLDEHTGRAFSWMKELPSGARFAPASYASHIAGALEVTLEDLLTAYFGPPMTPDGGYVIEESELFGPSEHPFVDPESAKSDFLRVLSAYPASIRETAWANRMRLLRTTVALTVSETRANDIVGALKRVCQLNCRGNIPYGLSKGGEVIYLTL